ncbi:MAG: RsmD family RNA methyltransferase [Gaiellales bacterium]
MRIVAGERKGARLSAPAGPDTRPTSDMVREAVFGILGGVDCTELLDPFAGSGALGLEALSRGAARAEFCELQPAALRALRDNIERLGYADRCVVRRQDGRRRLRDDHARGRTYDLMFIDPPYRMLPVLQDEFLLHLPSLLAPGGRLVIEGPSEIEGLSLPLELIRDRVHGGTRLTVYRHG